MRAFMFSNCRMGAFRLSELKKLDAFFGYTIDLFKLWNEDDDGDDDENNKLTIIPLTKKKSITQKAHSGITKIDFYTGHVVQE